MQQGFGVGVGVGVGVGFVGVSAGVGVAGGEANAISGTIAKMMRNIILPNHFEFFTQNLPQVNLEVAKTCGW